MIDSEGNTPLHLACDEDRGEVAAVLIEAGADCTIRNKYDKTPIRLASDSMRVMLRKIREV